MANDRALRHAVGGMAAAAVLLLGGCSTLWNMNKEPPASAKSLYGPQIPTGPVEGSLEQLSVNRSFNFTADEVLQATNNALLTKGLEVEIRDRKKGYLVGRGYWQLVCGGGPCNMAVSFAAYVQEIDAKPTVRLTFVLDRHGGMGHGGERKIANDLLIDVQRILVAK